MEGYVTFDINRRIILRTYKPHWGSFKRLEKMVWLRKPWNQRTSRRIYKTFSFPDIIITSSLSSR